MHEIKFKGKRIDNGEWVYGYYANALGVSTIIYEDYEGFYCEDEVRPETIGQFTGLYDKYHTEIYEDDIVQLTLSNGEVRNFVVDIDTVVREVVSHPDFDAPTSKVAITGVVFKWNNYELFPCVDENGKHDNEDMIVVGNIWDNPELLKSTF